jgi:hypothetical protein
MVSLGNTEKLLNSEPTIDLRGMNLAPVCLSAQGLDTVITAMTQVGYYAASRRMCTFGGREFSFIFEYLNFRRTVP